MNKHRQLPIFRPILSYQSSLKLLFSYGTSPFRYAVYQPYFIAFSIAFFPIVCLQVSYKQPVVLLPSILYQFFPFVDCKPGKIFLPGLQSHFLALYAILLLIAWQSNYSGSLKRLSARYYRLKIAISYKTPHTINDQEVLIYVEKMQKTYFPWYDAASAASNHRSS